MGAGFEVTTGTIGELFWNTSDGAVVCQPGQVLAWNPAAEAMLGLTSEQAIAAGKDLGAAFGADTEAFWDLVAEGAGEACLECVGGCGRALEARVWPLGGGQGAPRVVVLRDVTDDQRYQAGLQRLNALARQLLAEPSLDVLLTRIVDAAKDLSRADYSAILTLREGSEDEVRDFVYNAPRHLFPERLPRVVGLLALPVRTRAVTRVGDIRVHPAGVGIPVEHPPIAALLAAPILLADEVLGELAVANGPDRGAFDEVDEAVITELAAHAAIAMSLARARAAQEGLDDSRRAVIDSALQRIGTPLTVARGFLTALREQGADLSAEERAHAFDALERALDHIEALAEGAVVEEEHVALATPPLAAGVVPLRALLEELSAHADVDRGVRVVTAVEPGTPAVFVAEPRLVGELFDNLVGNAVKHSPPGETVTVTARQEGRSMRFDVTDRGPGIPAEEQSRVFEQFYRTRRSVAEQLPGSGLGLWIVRRLAEMHGGAVGLSSREGQGSTFWATFPLGASQELSAAAG